jgi:hypothetical protein
MEMNEQLYAIAYFSKTRQAFSVQDLERLASSSMQANRMISIDGFLFYKHFQFLQYIEGEKKAVLSLFNKIKNDQRHQVIAFYEDQKLVSRRFPNWSMRFIDYEPANYIELEDIWQKHMSPKKARYAHLYQHTLWSVIESISKRNQTLIEKESSLLDQFYLNIKT